MQRFKILQSLGDKIPSFSLLPLVQTLRLFRVRISLFISSFSSFSFTYLKSCSKDLHSTCKEYTARTSVLPPLNIFVFFNLNNMKMYLKRRLVKFKRAFKNFFPRLQFSRLQAQRLFLSYSYYNSPEHPCRFQFNMKISLKRRLVEFKGAYKHFFLRLQFSRLQTQ